MFTKLRLHFLNWSHSQWLMRASAVWQRLSDGMGGKRLYTGVYAMGFKELLSQAMGTDFS